MTFIEQTARGTLLTSPNPEYDISTSPEPHQIEDCVQNTLNLLFILLSLHSRTHPFQSSKCTSIAEHLAVISIPDLLLEQSTWTLRGSSSHSIQLYCDTLINSFITGIMTKQVTPTTIFVGGPLPSVFEHEVAEEPVMKPDKLKQLISPQKEDHKPSLEKRSVHMSPNVHYREIPHLNDLSDEEVNAVWLTPENFLETKKGYTQIVQMMMRSREPIEESDDICTRGLGTFMLLYDQNMFPWLCSIKLIKTVIIFRLQNSERRRVLGGESGSRSKVLKPCYWNKKFNKKKV